MFFHIEQAMLSYSTVEYIVGSPSLLWWLWKSFVKGSVNN